MAGTIGIKVADGSFYPIVGEKAAVGKKLVLTTVHDDQDSVQIDLYRSISQSMLDAQYIGSLVVEDIRQARSGEPSIGMTISSDENGYITAEAYDLDATPDSDHHVLNVSLRTMDTHAKPDDFPDFDMGESVRPVASQTYERDRMERERERKFPWMVMALAVLCVVIGIAALWFFLLRGTTVDAMAASEPGTEEAVQDYPVEPSPSVVSQGAGSALPETIAMPAPEQRDVELSPPVISAPIAPPTAPAQEVRRERPPAPVMSYRIPAVIPPNGVVYQIRWGDTLWDISAAFYRNPLLYPRIARYNNIRNPDRILAGFNVRIPPLN